jgi:alpha-beta hydrolase superfamily lysophospholipase
VKKASFKRLLIGDLTSKRVARSVIAVVLLVYFGVFACGWMFFNRIAFQPPPASYRDTSEVIKLASGEAGISAVYLRNPKARFTLLYSHGNAEDIGILRPTFEQIRQMGFSVFAFDYRGYGTSSGQPSEAGTYQDIDAAYVYLTTTQRVSPDYIIALGRSLGGAVAIDLGRRERLAGLIVESSFVSAFRVLTRFPLFPLDKFKSISKIKDVRCPVLVIHGTNDQIISPWHGQRLFQEANEPKLAYWVERAGHNDLFEVAGDGYERALKSFTDLIEKRSR